MKHFVRLLLASFFASLTVTQAAQSQTASFIFPVEALSAPKGPAPQYSARQVRRWLGDSVEKTSPLPDSLVHGGKNPVLGGFLLAYKEHRPIVLSPDMVWLLISQGFARHIANNAEAFRAELVGFEGKKKLTVSVNNVPLGDPQADWEQVFPEFTQQIAGYTGPDLLSTLTGDFSTTTPTTRICSQITVMEGVKSYFEYEIVMFGCGLPSVTLEGSPADWERVLAKTRALAHYRLDWWTKELEPVLQQFINTANGRGNRRFWMNMIKAHTAKQYGSPTTIDGWIVKFYPYTNKGQRTGFKPIRNIDNLPPESVEVPFNYVFAPTGKMTPMAFWAGFAGLRQNQTTYALRPEMVWAVLNKNKAASSEFASMEEIPELAAKNLTEVPTDLYSLRRIGTLRLSFLSDIVVPAELSRVQISVLYLEGKLAADKEPDLLVQFPNTAVHVNGHPLTRK